MIRVTTKLICILAGLYCLLALADGRGWTEPFVWAKVWPRTVLPRRPSPAEAHAADLANRSATVRQQIVKATESLGAFSRKRQGLVRQLRQRLDEHNGMDDPACLQADNPVAFALVRSIDAEDRRQAEARRELAELEQKFARLEARRIATDNGVSLTDPVAPSGPADQLRAETGEESAGARYRRIIREAAHRRNAKERP